MANAAGSRRSSRNDGRDLHEVGAGAGDEEDVHAARILPDRAHGARPSAFGRTKTGAPANGHPCVSRERCRVVRLAAAASDGARAEQAHAEEQHARRLANVRDLEVEAGAQRARAVRDDGAEGHRVGAQRTMVVDRCPENAPEPNGPRFTATGPCGPQARWVLFSSLHAKKLPVPFKVPADLANQRPGRETTKSVSVSQIDRVPPVDELTLTELRSIFA